MAARPPSVRSEVEHDSTSERSGAPILDRAPVSTLSFYGRNPLKATKEVPSAGMVPSRGRQRGRIFE
jgi:hypothetical protein